MCTFYKKKKDEIYIQKKNTSALMAWLLYHRHKYIWEFDLINLLVGVWMDISGLKKRNLVKKKLFAQNLIEIRNYQIWIQKRQKSAIHTHFSTFKP